MQRFVSLVALVVCASSMACATATDDVDGVSRFDGGRDTTTTDDTDEPADADDEDTATPVQDSTVKTDSAADTRADVRPSTTDASKEAAVIVDGGVVAINDAGDAGLPSGDAADGGGTSADSAGVDSAVMDTAGVDAAGFTCPDNSYDVDNSIANGCEWTENGTNHTAATAHAMGAVSECDTWYSFTSDYLSDTRTHTPSGADGTLGRPEYISAVHADDFLCQNNPTVELELLSGVGKYQVTVYRSSGTADPNCTALDVTGVGTTGEVLCSDQNDGEKVIFKVEKVSGPSEKARYKLWYHN